MRFLIVFVLAAAFSCALPTSSSKSLQDDQATATSVAESSAGKSEPTLVFLDKPDTSIRCLQFAKLPLKSIMGHDADRRCGGQSICSGPTCSGLIPSYVNGFCHDERGNSGSCQAINPKLYKDVKNYDGKNYLCLCVPSPKEKAPEGEMKSVLERDNQVSKNTEKKTKESTVSILERK